jgi:hypothetical protein
MLRKASEMLLGKRGSRVRLTVQRRGGGGLGGSGSVVELTLKRGAWGAEHAVVEEERSDMADLGRWPTPV